MQNLRVERDRVAKKRDEAWEKGVEFAEKASAFEKAYKIAVSERLKEEEVRKVYSKSNLPKIIDGELEIAEFYSNYKLSEEKSKFYYKLVDICQKDLRYIDEDIAIMLRSP